MVFYARQLLDVERNMAAHFADVDKNSIGHLFFGMSRQRSNAVFCDIWKQYHALYPNISISLEENNTEDLLAALRTHTIDMCIAVNVAPDKDMYIEPLIRERYFCCLTDTLLSRCRPKTWQADKEIYKEKGVDLSELLDLPFYIQPEQNRIGLTLKRLFATKETPPNIQLETNNQQLMFRLSDDGVSILSPSFLYNWYHTNKPSEDNWQIYPVTNEELTLNVSFVSLKGITLPKYALAFKEIVFQCFDNYGRFIREQLEGRKGKTTP